LVNHFTIFAQEAPRSREIAIIAPPASAIDARTMLTISSRSYLRIAMMLPPPVSDGGAIALLVVIQNASDFLSA
jgi:hypothetical protein